MNPVRRFHWLFFPFADAADAKDSHPIILSPNAWLSAAAALTALAC
jgi:hypothetical protein